MYTAHWGEGGGKILNECVILTSGRNSNIYLSFQTRIKKKKIQNCIDAIDASRSFVRRTRHVRGLSVIATRSISFPFNSPAMELPYSLVFAVSLEWTDRTRTSATRILGLDVTFVANILFKTRRITRVKPSFIIAGDRRGV